jgi:hypothetical protein
MNRLIALSLFALVALASPAAAQTGTCGADTTLVIGPTWICGEVVPAEHAKTNPLDASTPASYALLFFAPGVDTATGAPVQTINIGKPVLNAQGAFWLQRAELAAIPLGQAYRARMVAVNAAGQVSARSPESNPFGRPTAGVPVAPTHVGVR